MQRFKGAFIQEIWLPVGETGRFVLYPGELACMRTVLKNNFFFSEISLSLECFCCALCNGVCVNSTPEIALGDMD